MIEMDGPYRVRTCTRCGVCCNLKDIINDPEILLYIDAGFLKMVNLELVDGKTGNASTSAVTLRDFLNLLQCGYMFLDGSGRRVFI